ncbi:MAG TPA: acyltransferase [Rhodanobacter sp.]|nr:acyltransferase [Rhodanobacter sp.]
MTETEPLSHKSRRNRDIECLRAVAVIGVTFHHMQGDLFHPGIPLIAALLKHADFWYGVDLFFAISGFVIARSLLPQMATCHGQPRKQIGVIIAFWIRRFWRLVPSAWLWLGIILLASVVFNQSGVYKSIHANLMATLAGLLDVANFRFADAFFRYDYGASFVYWSLSLEEQFYLLLPLFAAILKRHIWLLMVVLFAVQLCLFRTPLLMSVRTDALALGVLLAIATPGRVYAALEPRFLLKLRTWRVILPLLLLAAMSVVIAPDLQYWRFRISAIAVLSATLVWLASYDRDYLLPEGMIKRVLTWTGARSYAIYLIHIPAYYALRETAFRLGVEPHAWVLFLLATTLIALLSDLNYRYLERPLRVHGRHVADRFLQRRAHDAPSVDAEEDHSATAATGPNV